MLFKINRRSLLLSAILILIIVGACNTILTYCVYPLIILMTFAICYRPQVGSGVEICKGIITLLLLQNFCIGIGAHLSGNKAPSLKLLTQIPFLVITFIWIFTCVVNQNKNISLRVKVSFTLLLGCIAISILIGFGGVMSAAVSIRNMSVFFMAYEIGAEHIKSKSDREEIIEYVISCAIVLFILGIILKVGGYSLYKAIGIHEVYIAKAAPFGEGRLDGRFYTSLFKNTSYIRMGSILYEPINLAYFFALAVICAIYDNPWCGRKKIASIVCTSTGLILTFGKGGYMIVGLVVGCWLMEYLLTSIRHIVGKEVISLSIIVTIIVATTLFIRFYITNIGMAVLNHIWGIVHTWENVCRHPWGYGLGTGGNVAQVLGSNPGDWLATGGETALMSFMYQIGIQGILVFTMCFIFIALDIKERKTNLEKIFFYIPFILLGISLLQDNTFTPQCIVPFMLIQGSLCNIKKSNSLILNERYLVNENKINSNVFTTIS